MIVFVVCRRKYQLVVLLSIVFLILFDIDACNVKYSFFLVTTKDHLQKKPAVTDLIP